MKNRGRSKFFMCFRPAVVEDHPVSGALCKAGGVGACGGKESAVIPIVSRSISEKSLKEFSNVDDSRCRRSKSFRCLNRLLKGLLLDVSLSKKLRNKKSRRIGAVNGLSKSDKFSESVNEKSYTYTETSDTDDSTLRINSTSSSSTFSSSLNASSSLSSSCESSLSSNSRSCSHTAGLFQVESNQITKRENEDGISCSTSILCLFLLCLVVLIMWGKLCAIFCTLACFFLCSRRIEVVKSAVDIVEFPVNLSEEYKKKIIMDGLLDRNRSSIHL